MKKTIQLTEEQQVQANRTWKQIHTIEKTLSNLVIQAAEDIADKESDFWDQIEQLAGVSRKTHHFKYQMISGTILVTPIEEP